MGHRRWRGQIVGGVLVALLAATVPRARADTPISADTAPGTKGNEEDARRIFRRGQGLFDQHQYAPAAEEFEDAYRVAPHPLFLYNAALAHRLARNDERSLYFYRLYLRVDPKSKVRQQALESITELEKTIAAAEFAPPVSPRPAVAPPPAVAEPPAVNKAAPPSPAPEAVASSSQATVVVAADANRTPVYKKWWLWTIVGVVVVGVVVGAAVGATSSSGGPSGPPAIHF